MKESILIRLDDACEFMDVSKWSRLESILDKYGVKPVVGIVPQPQDEEWIHKYPPDEQFWQKVETWKEKKWELAMHGFSHHYSLKKRRRVGINPVNSYTEFAGIALNCQKEKIAKGIAIFNDKDIEPRVFFAPAHTFDLNTVSALRECSNIRIIHDTYASDIYHRYGMFFVPVIPLGPHIIDKIRWMNSRLLTKTFVYHPNMMVERDFAAFEAFISMNREHIIAFDDLVFRPRKYGFNDKLIKFIYCDMIWLYGFIKKNFSAFKQFIKHFSVLRSLHNYFSYAAWYVWNGSEAVFPFDISDVTLRVATDWESYLDIYANEPEKIEKQYQEWFAGQNVFFALQHGDDIVTYGWSSTLGCKGFRVGLDDMRVTIPENTCYLYNFNTYHEWRGRGYYPTLLMLIQRYYANKQLFIYARAKNTSSRKGLTKSGFECLGEYRSSSVTLKAALAKIGVKAVY